MAPVVIVQHGEKRREPGDPGLTTLGVRQSRCVATALAAERPVAVVSSPLRRARETAAPLAAAAGLPVRIDARLRERLNLEPATDVSAFLRVWERSARERDWAPPGGRSSADCGAEMLRALEDHAVEDRLVVLVGHGGATTDLLRTLLGDDALEGRAPGLVVDGVLGGAITRLTRDREAWQVDRIADVRHLPSEDRTDHSR